MAKWIKTAGVAVAGMIVPIISRAQGLANEINGLHGVLDQLYDEMMPLCSQLIGVGQGIAVCSNLVYCIPHLAAYR